jgi:hypothetical protein
MSVIRPGAGTVLKLLDRPHSSKASFATVDGNALPVQRIRDAAALHALLPLTHQMNCRASCGIPPPEMPSQWPKSLMLWARLHISPLSVRRRPI